VRLAIDLLIDKEALLQSALRGEGRTTASPSYPTSALYDAALKNWLSQVWVLTNAIDNLQNKSGRDCGIESVPARSSIDMPTAVANQCVELTAPKVPMNSGRAVNFGPNAIAPPCWAVHAEAPPLTTVGQVRFSDGL